MLKQSDFENGNKYLAYIHDTCVYIAAPQFKTVYDAVRYTIRYDNNDENVRRVEFYAAYNLEKPIYEMRVYKRDNGRFYYVIKDVRTGKQCDMFSLTN
jgi:hypothetical protein